MAPRFTIIVPTRNRADCLDRCLAAMATMQAPGTAFEIIVVDDGSNPPPTDVIARYAETLPLRCLRTEGVGPARARNVALREATGDYILFTDDDCRPSRGWLRAYTSAIEQHPGDGFGGAIIDAPKNNLFERTSQILVSFLYAYNETTDAIRFFCSNNFAFPRRELQAMGGFDEAFPLAAGEDRYLCAHWLGFSKLHFVPDAIMEHRQTLGFRGFVQQQFRYGRGAFQFWQRRHAEHGAVNQVQPLRFYIGMLTFPFGRERPERAIAMSLLLALSQAAGFCGYIYEQGRFHRAAGIEAAVKNPQQKGTP